MGSLPLGAVFCMIYKRVTDDEANKLFYFLQKFSREWPLLNNVTWEENGAIFADITYGSYIIIVIGLIIGQCSGELQRCRKLENFFLLVGALLFIAAGSLELAALESVEERLVDNAAILGVVSLLTGFLFLIDLLTAKKRRKKEKIRFIQKSTLSKPTQTEEKKPSDMMNVASDLNGNLQTAIVPKDHEGTRIPKNAVKLLPSSPDISDYILSPEKHANSQYIGPVGYYMEPPAIDGEDLKTHEGRIRSTESFLRSEKGLYPKLRKSPEHDRPNNHYFIPTGYVLVPADRFLAQSPTKSDSGIGESYTPPGYAQIVPGTKGKPKKDSDNYVIIPLDQDYRAKDHSRNVKQSDDVPDKNTTHSEFFYVDDRGTSPHSLRLAYKVNSSDASDFEEGRPEDRYKYDGKQTRSAPKNVGRHQEIDGDKYVVHSEDSSDEQKPNGEYSRPSSRFSHRSKEWHQKHRGKINDAYADEKDHFPFSGRGTPYQSSTTISSQEKPKSILRFDYGRSSKRENGLHFPKDVQYNSLDGQKIAEDLRTLKEITKSDLNLSRDFERSYQVNEKVKRDNLRVSALRLDSDDDEKDRRVSEREEQYFGLKDLKQSHRERKFQPMVSIKQRIEDAGKISKEIAERQRKKYTERSENQTTKETQDYNDLIDERFYFLDEEDKRKKKSTLERQEQESSGNIAGPDRSRVAVYGKDNYKAVDKQKSDSDDTNYTQSTDEEIRLRVGTPGSASYKSEALVWVDNARGTPAESSTPISPASPGYVLYTAQNWPESPSPQDRFNFNAKEAQQLSIKQPSKTQVLERLRSDFSSLDENLNSQKSRLLDFIEPDKSGGARSKGLLVRKDEQTPKKPLTEFRSKPVAITGSTSTWKKWLQPKPKLILTKSSPN
ncbi:hypothetical protein RUM43_004785 [Polyplax serrata]|uniref:Uncharacterized protein n=1 Tax=Polyplax serrata TaxID=468196 RepID=A0AAN8SDY5_POLSC